MKHTKFIMPILVVLFFFTLSFYKPKCEHIFTRIEKPIIEKWTVYLGDVELICVKCYHTQIQKVVQQKNTGLVMPDTTQIAYPLHSMHAY